VYGGSREFFVRSRSQSDVHKRISLGTPFDAESPPEHFAKGQRVEYYSTTAGKWIQCIVTNVESGGGVQLDVKPGAWIFKEEQPGRIRVPQTGPYSVGDQLEYNSASQGRWVNCTVAVVEPDGSIQINVKLGYLIGFEEQAEKLRIPQESPAEAPAVAIGQRVEYHSRSLDKWIPCHITAVEPGGDIQIDVKPGHSMSKAEQLERIRLPLSLDLRPKGPSFKVGQEVEKFDPTNQHWVKDMIESVDATGSVALNTSPNVQLTPDQQLMDIRIPRSKFLYYS